MKKSALLYFILILTGVVLLYTIFPLDPKVETPTINTQEQDPMKAISLSEIKNKENLEEQQELERLEKEREIEEQLQKEAQKEELEEDKNNEESEKTEEDKKAEEQEKIEKEKKKQEEAKREEERKKEKEKQKKEDNDKPNEKISKIIRYAKSKLGKPYKQAGTTDTGYDCSGLIMVSYKKYNVRLPRASYEMAKKGTEVQKSEARPGDLIFFATKPNQPKRVSHVGMVTAVKDNKIYFIHSSDKAGVILNTLDQGYYKKRFLKIKRYIK